VTNEQVLLVQQTFAKVAPITDQAAALFYKRLFELDPSARALFKIDMTEQGKKLMQMIGIAVAGLSMPESIRQAVADLGVRHVSYGVTEAQYDTVGAALLWTLGQGLGPAFTKDVEVAWTEAYTLLATIMKQAAAAKKQAASS
jgi:hemoglobin-like flavoprotein